MRKSITDNLICYRPGYSKRKFENFVQQLGKDHLLVSKYCYKSINIRYLLYNPHQKPSFQDNLFIWFNGRCQNIITVLSDPSRKKFIEELTKYGSFLIFDYGVQKGLQIRPSFSFLVDDFKHLTRLLQYRKVNFLKCTFIGFSLGSITASNFATFLKAKGLQIKQLVLWNPVYQLDEIITKSANYIINKTSNSNLVQGWLEGLRHYNCQTLNPSRLAPSILIPFDKWDGEKLTIKIIQGKYDKIIPKNGVIEFANLVGCHLKLVEDDHYTVTDVKELVGFIQD